jgi:hypothetical protein
MTIMSDTAGMTLPPLGQLTETKHRRSTRYDKNDAAY